MACFRLLHDDDDDVRLFTILISNYATRERDKLTPFSGIF